MVAQHPLTNCAHTFYGMDGMLIAEVRFKLDAEAIEIFKCILQQQVFTLRVYSSSLILRCIPGPPNFQRTVRGLHIEETRRSDDDSRFLVDDGKWKIRPGSLEF